MSMIVYINGLLEELAELEAHMGENYCRESLTYRIMREGPEGAAIKSSAGTVIPLESYRIARRLLKIHRAKMELSIQDRDIVDTVYRIYEDPKVNKLARHLFSLLPKTTFYRRLHTIHEKLDENLRKIKIEA